MALYGYGRGLAPLAPGFTSNSQLLSYECHMNGSLCPSSSCPKPAGPCTCGKSEARGEAVQEPRRFTASALHALRAVSTTENPVFQYPPPQDSPFPGVDFFLLPALHSPALCYSEWEAHSYRCPHTAVVQIQGAGTELSLRQPYMGSYPSSLKDRAGQLLVVNNHT